MLAALRPVGFYDNALKHVARLPPCGDIRNAEIKKQ